jgi:hypothetical protein
MQYRWLAVIAVWILVAGIAAPEGRQMTPMERQRLLAHLEMTGSWLLDEIRGLTAAQLAFKRSPDEWSIAQVIDHLLVVGPIYWNDLQVALKSPAGQRENINSDANILWYGIDRSNPEKALSTEVPMGRFKDLPGAIAEYRKTHERLVQYVKTTDDDLRSHYVARQGSDAYQWVLLISTHEQRHILQIREIKAHTGFPK